jgi:hypothetical protein
LKQVKTLNSLVFWSPRKGREGPGRLPGPRPGRAAGRSTPAQGGKELAIRERIAAATSLVQR